jgi:hypothetical protein
MPGSYFKYIQYNKIKTVGGGRGRGGRRRRRGFRPPSF